MVDHLTEQDVIDLLDRYSPVVKHIARSACYSSDAIDINDLCQVGNIAVLQAIRSYDPSCGTSIKSFVGKVVRNEIFREAARFLGVLTVDPRSTKLASKIHKMHQDGHTDNEIVLAIQSDTLDVDTVHDLRMAYGHRQYESVDEISVIYDGDLEESTIRDLVMGVTRNKEEETIVELRILSRNSIRDIAKRLKLSRKYVYIIENDLKSRIRIAIEGISE